MKVKVSGKVASVEPTRQGARLRAYMETAARVNDLLMFPADAKVKAGDVLTDLECVVKADHDQAGRPNGYLVFWVGDGGAEDAA